MKDLLSSKRETLYCFLFQSGKPRAITSFVNNSVTSITVEVESLPKAFIGKVYKTGSKFEFTTAS